MDVVRPEAEEWKGGGRVGGAVYTLSTDDAA
jgi:hypothetical protein